jgi:hypothetical protein
MITTPNALFRLVLGFLILIASTALTACGPVYQTTYNYVPPVSFAGKQCVNSCLHQQSYCNLMCQQTYTMCRSSADLAAEPAFRAYVKRRQLENKSIDLTVSYFANYSGCDNSCGCANTYNQCFSNCGGNIIPNTQCVAFCDKAQPQSAGPVKR